MLLAEFLPDFLEQCWPTPTNKTQKIYIIKLLCSCCFLIKKSLFLFVSSHFWLPSFLRLPLFSSSSSLHLCQFAARRLAAQPLAISSTHLANPQTHLFSLFTQIGIWVIGFFCVCVWLIFAQIGIWLLWFLWLWLYWVVVIFFLMWALVEVVASGVVVEVVVVGWKVFVVDIFYFILF